MYTYKRAVGISLLDPKGQELLDISTIQTNQLFTLYRDLILVVTDEFVFQDVSVDALTYQADLTAFSGTIQAWLDSKVSTPLITSNVLPSNEYRYVTAQDIRYKWFSLFPGNTAMAEDRQDLLTTGSAPDIRVKKTDNTQVDYDALVERCLWGINGHLVRAVKGEDSVYLLNAGKHFNINDNSHVQCFNFNTVSTLNTYPIELEDIEYLPNDTYSFLHVKAPVTLLGKTVWMVIGGRPYFGDVVEVNSADSVVIRVERVSWFSRIFDSKGLIDLSSIILPDREVVPADFFKTSDFFTKLLTDPSSFWVVLDNPHVYMWTKPIETYHSPFTYHTEETLNVPLMTGGGLLPAYRTRKIINRRLLDIDLGIQKEYVNETTGIHNEGNLYHGYTNGFKPSHLHQGYLLYIRGLAQQD